MFTIVTYLSKRKLTGILDCVTILAYKGVERLCCVVSIYMHRKHGIFRLTSPGGMSVIRQCPQRGFHPHNQPPDGGPIYDTCADVYMNPDLKFDVIDLR